MDNRDILRLYLDRDQRAIEETDKKYKRYLLTIAMNILNSREDAEECLNDTYIAAWNSISAKAPDNLKLYLARIVKNKALHVIEKQNAGKRGGGQAAIALEELEDIAAEVNPENDYIKSLDSKMIEAFLDTLPELDRKIFVRRYWFFEKIGDISELYDVSLLTVNIRLRGCRKKLKKFLLSHGYEE